ncbi:terminase small subunit [Paenibacillus alkalitolerans]|uniref:terminase small subunit n=1 Tax=Paenibacillus alkalitolerans TaxID=2799335 RepID=UPI0018F32B46|nr:terminase small subunit [Paenibacillus alkalitolerans]
MALSDKHMRFVDEYMIDMNAAAAYLRAGYKCNEDTARANASRLLTNANIQAEIANRQEKIQEESGMSVKWVLEKYKKIIEDNITVDPAVAKSALDSVGKHYGMFTDKVKLEGSLTVEKLLDQIS